MSWLEDGNEVSEIKKRLTQLVWYVNSRMTITENAWDHYVNVDISIRIPLLKPLKEFIANSQLHAIRKIRAVSVSMYNFDYSIKRLPSFYSDQAIKSETL